MESIFDICGECGCEIKENKQEHGGDCYCSNCYEENFATCSNCRKIISIDDSIQHANEDYCEDCYNELFTCCHHCNETIWQDDAICQDDNIYCQSCFDDLYTQCSDCNDVISVDATYGGRCESCADNYTCCDSCGDEIHIDNARPADNGCYCESCYDDNSIIHDYSYKPTPKFYGKDIMYFGYELEVECGDGFPEEIAEKINNYEETYIKGDGSLDNGFEVVSHPCTLDYHVNNADIPKMMSKLIDNNCTSHNAKTCGLHVHVSKQAFTEIELIKLAGFVYSNKLFFETLARRKECTYSKFKNKPINGEQIKDLSCNSDRYEAINFKNSKTVEFRLYKGTLKYETFIATLELTHATCNFIKTINLHECFKPETQRRFVKFINEASYKYLPAYLKLKNIV